jgi:ring-1,2-phenylacetyl-CoA epoxidase subunit PaaD
MVIKQILDQHTAAELAGAVPDPELPVITLAELGVLRRVSVQSDGAVEVVLTPTYLGCPALEAMVADVERVLREHGCPEVSVRTELSPAWTTDWITDSGRRKLAAAGIAPPPPTRMPWAAGGPVPLSLSVRCPRCGCLDTDLTSRFSSTACKALYRCRGCSEPFEQVKAV